MLPDDLLKRIDLVAAQEGLSRSKLIRLAFLAYCEQREEGFKRERRQADIEHGMALEDSLRSESPPGIHWRLCARSAKPVDSLRARHFGDVAVVFPSARRRYRKGAWLAAGAIGRHS